MSIALTRKIDLFVNQLNVEEKRTDIADSIANFFGTNVQDKFVVAKENQLLYYVDNKLQRIMNILVNPDSNNMLRFDGNVIDTAYFHAFADPKKKGKGGSGGGVSSNNNNNNNNNNNG